MNTPIEDLFALAEEAIAPVIWTEKKALQKFKEAATPERVREVAEAFRALEQRAEAAEVKLETKEQELAQYVECFEAEAERADRNHEKLAELERQAPYGTLINTFLATDPRAIAEARKRGIPTVEVFTRPAPAINLAELVPDLEEDEPTFNAGLSALIDCLEDCGDAEQGLRLALRSCRAAILSNMEGAK